MQNVNYRVRVDWDGDGFVNSGGLQGAPKNLFPSAIYPTDAKLFSSWFPVATVREPDERGIVKGSMVIGDPSSGETNRFFWDGYLLGQPHAGDPQNLIPGSRDCSFVDTLDGRTVRSDLSVKAHGNALGAIRIKKADYFSSKLVTEVEHFDNSGSTPVYGMTLGFVPIFGGLPKYIDTANIRNDSNVLDANGNWWDVVSSWTSTTPEFSGIPITAGQSYTLVFRAENASKYFIYTNGGSSSAPFYNRQFIAKGAFPSTENVAVTFTAPSGATQLIICATTTSNRISMGGFQLFSGTVALPSRFWDTSFGYLKEQFSVVTEANTYYYLSFWAKSTNETEMTFTPYMFEIGGANAVNTLTPVYADLRGNDWVRIDVPIPNNKPASGVGLVATTILKNGTSFGPDGDVNVKVAGFMLTEGNAPVPFNYGDGAPYDDVTPYVISIQTKSGKQSRYDALPYEGTASIVLNNDSKIFSLNHPSSPLRGLSLQNSRVYIDIEVSGTWQTVWTGWTQEMQTTPGRTTDRRAQLECAQGLYRMRDGGVSASVQYNTTLDALIQELVLSSGWISPAEVTSSIVGFSTRLDENAYTHDPTLTFSRVDDGINVLDLAGIDWGKKSRMAEVIRDALDSENAQLWIDRNGQLQFINRDFWTLLQPVDTINLDYYQGASYNYGRNIINYVEVFLERARTASTTSVWKTRRAVEVKAGRSVTVNVMAEYTEGRQKTIISYTLDGATKTVYSKAPSLDYSVTTPASSAQAGKVDLDLKESLGNSFKLIITNNNPVTMWVDVELQGKLANRGDRDTRILVDEASIEKYNAIRRQKIDVPLVTQEKQADAVGSFLLLNRANAYSEFDSLTVIPENATEFTRFLGLTTGECISIRETQTGETDLRHVIIGEEFQIDNGHLEITFRLGFVQTQNYAHIDGTLHKPTANFVDDPDNIKVVGTGYLEKTEDGNIFFTGLFGDSLAILTPAQDQVVNVPVLGVSVWPRLTSSGDTTDRAKVMDVYSALAAAQLAQILPTEDEEYADTVLGVDVKGVGVPSPALGGSVQFVPYLGATITNDQFSTDTELDFAFNARIPLQNTSSAGAIWEIRQVVRTYGASYEPMYFTAYYENATNHRPTVARIGGYSSFPRYSPTVSEKRHRLNGILPPAMMVIENFIYADVPALSASLSQQKPFMALRNIFWRSSFNSMGVPDRYGGLFAVNLIRYSRVYAIKLPTSTSHEYTVFLRNADVTNVGQTKMVLEVWDGVDGTLIGSDSDLITNATTKLSVSIPNTETWVFAILRPSTPQEKAAKLLIEAHGITESSVTTPDELNAPATTSAILGV